MIDLFGEATKCSVLYVTFARRTNYALTFLQAVRVSPNKRNFVQKQYAKKNIVCVCLDNWSWIEAIKRDFRQIDKALPSEQYCSPLSRETKTNSLFNKCSHVPDDNQTTTELQRKAAS